MSKKNLNFLIFGTLPPPHGGVSISILNLTTAINSLNMNISFVSKSNIYKFQTFDVAHIHYSKKWKVLVAILLGKLLAKKTVVTKHGAGFYPQENILDKIILTLTDGLIVLNNEVYNRCLSKKNIIKLPPIFKEGVITTNLEKVPYFTKEHGVKYLLIYASGKVYIENQEVYGVHFILDLLPELDEKTKVILLDPNAEYKDDIKGISSTKLIYIDKFIDFNTLVSSVDIYIRPTTSDGNSVATLEALSLEVAVLASDVVERDENIITYKLNNKKDFLYQLNQLLNKEKNIQKYKLKSIQEYITFCTKL